MSYFTIKRSFFLVPSTTMLKEFEKIDKNDYVKFKVNRYEYDVLVEDKSKFKRKYDFKIIDKPTLDDIMLIYIKGEK